MFTQTCGSPQRSNEPEAFKMVFFLWWWWQDRANGVFVLQGKKFLICQGLECLPLSYCLFLKAEL